MSDHKDRQTQAIMSYKENLGKYCLDCKEHMYNICDMHSSSLAIAAKYIRSGVPVHYIKELLEGEIVEKTCQEYDMVDKKLLPPFKGYEGLFNSYISNIDGKVLDNSLSLLFYSFNGAGKTHTSLHLLSEGLKKGLSCQYIVFKDLMFIYNRSEFAREKDSEELYHSITSSDLLVIDELGKESSTTPNILGALENIIKHRTCMSKATILITNLDVPSTLENKYGSSVSNALLQNYRAITFSKHGNFRAHFRKKWDI
jgi:hypothetical protein